MPYLTKCYGQYRKNICSNLRIVGCKVEKKTILKYYGKKIFLIKDCKTKSIGMFIR